VSTTEETRKQFFKKLGNSKGEDAAEMSFIDHLEALRWHLVRGVIAWAVAFIAIFFKVDWVFDNII
jgi:sec-independent protein translocase protein TatC